MELFDPATGEVFDHGGAGGEDVPDRQHRSTKDETRELREDLAESEREVRRLRRERGALRKELEEKRNTAKEKPFAVEVFDHWIERTGRNPKRAKLGDKRLAAVLARLRERSGDEGAEERTEYLKQAVDGLAVAANTSSTETQRQVLLAVMQAAIEAVDDETAAELRRLYTEGMKGVQVYDDLELLCRNEVNVERFAEVGARIAANSGD